MTTSEPRTRVCENCRTSALAAKAAASETDTGFVNLVDELGSFHSIRVEDARGRSWYALRDTYRDNQFVYPVTVTVSTAKDFV